MRKWTTMVLVAVIGTQAGCFGKFRLSQKVLEFNDGLSDSMVIKEVAFLAMVIIPVYEVAVLVDAIVLNTVEFATGSNPVATHRSLELDGATVAFTRIDRGIVVSMEQDGRVEERVFRRHSGTWEVLDGQGQRVALLREGPDGTVEVVGPDDEPLASWTRDQVDYIMAYAHTGDWEGTLAALHTTTYGGPSRWVAR